METEQSAVDALVAEIPRLRKVALSLTHDQERADDLVQETLLRAWAYRDSFAPGTSLKAWMLTILRHKFYTDYHRAKREVADSDGAYAARLTSPPEQEGHLALESVVSALDLLLPDQRRLLLLFAVQGLSQEEAAQVSGCCVGTVKSRVSRARKRLASLTGMDDAEEIGQDRVTKSVLNDPRGW